MQTREQGIIVKSMREVFIILERANAVVVSSEPGCGKSAETYQILVELQEERKNIDYVFVYPPGMRPEDVGGYPIPILEEKVVEFYKPKFVAIIEENIKKDIRTYAIFEEVNDAAEATIRALQLFTFNYAYSRETKNLLKVLFLTNPEGISSNRTFLTPPMNNRLIHCTLIPDLNFWAEGFIKLWGKPEWHEINRIYSEEERRKWYLARKIIVEFLQTFPQYFITYEQGKKIYASPRSWYLLSLCLIDVDLRDYYAIEQRVNGTVGSDISPVFIEFLRDKLVVKPEEVFENPQVLDLYLQKERVDKSHEISSILAQYIREIESFEDFAKILVKIPEVKKKFAEYYHEDVFHAVMAAISEKAIGFGIMDAIRLVALMKMASPSLEDEINYFRSKYCGGETK